MSARFSSLSRASRNSRCRYSKSCFNTIDDRLNLPQISIDTPGNLAPSDALSAHLFLNGLDFSEVLVNQAQILHVLLAEAIGCNGFCRHGGIVSVQRQRFNAPWD